MRQQRRCAECSGTQFYVLDQVLTPAHDSNSAVAPVRLFSHYAKTGETGFLGAKYARISVGMEAWVCAACARVAVYARGLDALARFAAEGVEGVHCVSAAPSGGSATSAPHPPSGGFPVDVSAHVSGSFPAPDLTPPVPPAPSTPPTARGASPASSVPPVASSIPPRASSVPPRASSVPPLPPRSPSAPPQVPTTKPPSKPPKS